MSTTVGSEVQNLEFARQADQRSLGSMDAKCEPTPYHSEYGYGMLVAEKNHVGTNRMVKSSLGTPEPGL
jgi:hypothetical protein